MILVSFFHIPTGFQLRKNAFQSSVHIFRRPWSQLSFFFLLKVTTQEGIRSHRVELKVETPEAFILAEDEYHIERGSSLSLVCIIEKATEPPQ